VVEGADRTAGKRRTMSHPVLVGHSVHGVRLIILWEEIRMRKLTRRTWVIVATTVVGLTAAGAAWAAWNLTGSGTASAKAGSVVNLSVESAGLADGALSPGNPTAVRMNVKNENKFPVKITNIDLTNLQSTVGTCVGTENVDVLNDVALPADVIVPAAVNGAVVKEIVWSGPLKMKNDPVDSCQNAGFSFNVHLDAVSAAS
jgi:hypothetical protein